MPNQPPTAKLDLIQDLVALRKRERYCPVVDVISVRVQRTLKARITTLALTHGTSESEIIRLLINRAMASEGIDALAPIGLGAAQ